ncbi:hypothetical protein [Paraburkholderia hayleyella]|uniref:hypothetical protein n=1 Tax=Paraburkholderia hayleyella TaxID=2152889 RepID=UPI0012909BAA|nr:hypothetical protein [Paraburkholderia hayleyella]
MADADLKPRRTRKEHVTCLSVALEQVPATRHTEEHGKRAAFPWMQIADDLLERLGFMPGQQVLFCADHRGGCISISPDHDYRIAGHYMNPAEAADMLQRRARRKGK